MAKLTRSDIDDLAARFSAALVPRAEWTHEAHLVVGAWHVHHFGSELALERLRLGIRRLNETHGTANSDSGGYHETVTRAYVVLLAQVLESAGPEIAFEEQVDGILAGPVGRKDVLRRFFSSAILASTRARRDWVEPDLAPLELPT